MEKIYVQRKIEVWVEDIYHVEDLSEETLEKAINYDLDYEDCEVLWETQIDLDPVEVFDQHYKKIYSNINYDNER